MRRWLPLLALLGGCLQFGGVDYVIDLKAGTATLTWRDLRGDGADDFKQLIGPVSRDRTFAPGLDGATLVRQEPVANGETLDFVVEATFTDPAQVGLMDWDARHPTRLCPPDNVSVTESNAAYRDADGCLIWRKGTQVLRLHATARALSPEAEAQSLLPAFQAWAAEGRPAALPAEAAP